MILNWIFCRQLISYFDLPSLVSHHRLPVACSMYLAPSRGSLLFARFLIASCRVRF